MTTFEAQMTSDYTDRLFFTDQHGFNDLALDLFQFQLKNNPVYAKYVSLLKKDLTKIRQYDEIPFMPVALFKSEKLLLQGLTEEKVFESSSTTGTGISKHYIPSLSHYNQVIERTFTSFFGPPDQYAIFGLLPGYLERQHSSLVYMVQHLMHVSGFPGGFYMQDHESLMEAIYNVPSDRTVMLFGVTWALLDFSEKHPPLPKNTVVIETGGMKGRRKEIIRDELHLMLKKGLGLETIYTEYGMTELHSMAYSNRDGLLALPPWMRIVIVDKNDPFQKIEPGATGRICLIDLANYQTCPFIATSDLGIEHPDGTFEVLGRTDNSDIRGCSLMAL